MKGKNLGKEGLIIDLTYDSTFKYFFKSVRTRLFLELLVSFILSVPLEDVKKNLVIEDSDLADLFNKEERGKITDCLVRYKNTLIDFEMNRKFYLGLYDIKLRYIYHLHNVSFLKGMDDSKERFIQVNINDFAKGMNKSLEEYKFACESKILTKKIKVINISLVKLKKAWDNNVTLSKLEKLLLFLKMSQYSDEKMKKLIKEEEVLKEMERIRERLSYSESLQREFDKEVEDERERRLIEKTKLLEGIEHGTKLGVEQEKMNTAKNLLSKGMDIKFVQEITGLKKKIINTLL